MKGRNSLKGGLQEVTHNNEVSVNELPPRQNVYITPDTDTRNPWQPICIDSKFVSVSPAFLPIFNCVDLDPKH